MGSDIRVDRDLEAFVAEQQPRLLASMVLMTGDLAAAEDLAQEALLRLVSRWDRVRGLDSPPAWLHRVAINLARSRWRRLQTALHRRTALAEPPTVAADLDEVIVLREELGRLPVRQREALVLRHVVGLDPAQTAHVLGCSEQAVRNLTHRAGALLRERLSSEGTSR